MGSQDCFHFQLSSGSLQLLSMSLKLVFNAEQVNFVPSNSISTGNNLDLKGSMCSCTIQFTPFPRIESSCTDPFLSFLIRCEPLPALMLEPWHLILSAFYFMLNDSVLFRSSVIMKISSVAWMCRGDGWMLNTPSTLNPSCFPFWKIKMYKGSCMSNLFTVVLCHDQLSFRSASLLPWTLLCSFLGIASSRKWWPSISSLLLRLLTTEVKYAVWNSLGLNISPWWIPLVTGLRPTVHCHPLSLKIQPRFCPPCSLPSLLLPKLVMRMSEIILKGLLK